MVRKIGPITIVNAVLCDDVRSEANTSKHMLIGTYSGDIRVGGDLPAQIPLSLYLELDGPVGAHDVELRLSGPGKGKATLQGRLEQEEAGASTLVLSRAYITMEKEGVFKIDIRLREGGRWVNLVKKSVLSVPPTASAALI